MSRYAVNKALWQVSRDDAAAQEYLSAPEAFLAGRSLTDEEHRWVLHRDFAAMFAAGCYPFLLYTFRIVVSGGWTWQLMVDHVGAIAHIPPPLDITT